MSHTMDLRERVAHDLKKAMKSGDGARVSTLRLLQAQLKNEEIALKKPSLTDEEVLRIVQREMKKRKEAAEGFRSGDRQDAARREDEERGILEAYLPPQLSDAELLAIIRDVVAATGASGREAAGKVVGSVMAKVRGQADGARVKALVENTLFSS